MIVLDSHALLWLADDPERLSDAAAGAIEHESELAVSTVSIQEISYLVARGRIEVGTPIGRWMRSALRAHQIEPVAPTVSIAVRAGSLDAETFPGDPADRVIYATALELGVRLVTADQKVATFDPTRVIW